MLKLKNIDGSNQWNGIVNVSIFPSTTLGRHVKLFENISSVVTGEGQEVYLLCRSDSSMFSTERSPQKKKGTYRTGTVLMIRRFLVVNLTTCDDSEMVRW